MRRHPAFRSHYNGTASALARMINDCPYLPHTYNSERGGNRGGIQCSPGSNHVSVSFSHFLRDRVQEWVEAFEEILPDRYRVHSRSDNQGDRQPGDLFVTWLWVVKAPRPLTPAETFDLFVVSGERSYPWVEEKKYSKAAKAGLDGPVGARWTVTYTLFDPDHPDDDTRRATAALNHRRCLEILALMAQDTPPQGTTEEAHRAARHALEHPDEADLDADAADQLIQIAVYGEVRYA